MHQPPSPASPGSCRPCLPAAPQALSYGQQLRRRYIEELKLLQEHYVPGAIHAKSTMMHRTVATLQGVLSGLYTAGERAGAAATDGAAALGRHGGSTHAQHSGRQLLSRGGGSSSSGGSPGLGDGSGKVSGDGEAVVPVDVTGDAHEYLYGHNRSCPALGPTFAELQQRVEGAQQQGLGLCCCLEC
jgi:hypothetical protein